VHVVEHEADLAGSVAPNGVGQGRAELAGAHVTGLVDAGHVGAQSIGQPVGQGPMIAVAGIATEPVVVAPGRQGVLVDCLDQQRRLAEARPGGEHRHASIPPLVHPLEQQGPPDQRTSRPGRREAIGPRHRPQL
jgi:hypothetical protein